MKIRKSQLGIAERSEKEGISRWWMALAAVFILGLGVGLNVKPATMVKPSELLKFRVPTQQSEAYEVRAVQAELCRHGIECVVDGKFGKQTAIGICELLSMIEEGYEVTSIYKKGGNSDPNIEQRDNLLETFREEPSRELSVEDEAE